MQNTWLENRIIKKLAKFLLPAVTSEDAGKTAVVDSSGAWSVGEGGGGGGGLSIIKGVYDETKTETRTEGNTTIYFTKYMLTVDGEPVTDLETLQRACIVDFLAIREQGGNIIANFPMHDFSPFFASSDGYYSFLNTVADPENGLMYFPNTYFMHIMKIEPINGVYYSSIVYKITIVT